MRLIFVYKSDVIGVEDYGEQGKKPLFLDMNTNQTLERRNFGWKSEYLAAKCRGVMFPIASSP